MAKFTAKQKAKCAKREAHMRRSVYPRRNNGEPLTSNQTREIEIMEEIQSDYEKEALKEENDLFKEH